MTLRLAHVAVAGRPRGWALPPELHRARCPTTISLLVSRT